MSLKEKENDLIALFEWIEDDMDRYQTLIDYGEQSLKNLLKEEDKTPENEVKGCQSKVWLTHQFSEGIITFYAESNTVITKGIVAILVNLWSGLSPSEVHNANTEILDTIGLRSHLTSQRNNGLNAMIAKMKTIAQAYI